MKVGMRVRVKVADGEQPQNTVGKVYRVAKIQPNGLIGLDVPGAKGEDGLWWWMPYDLEVVGSAKIHTQKLMVQGTPCREIMGFEGMLRIEELPAEYLEGVPRFAVCNGRVDCVRIFDGHTLNHVSVNRNMREYVDFDLPKNEFVGDLTNMLFVGDIIPEDTYQVVLMWLRRAGARLAKTKQATQVDVI